MEALGECLGNAARLIQHRTKAPMAICGSSVLAAAGLALQPHLDIEIDGRSIPASELHPLEALGFVPQIDRLAKTAAGAAVWPDAAIGSSIVGLFPRR